jgi:hypothetical protein
MVGFRALPFAIAHRKNERSQILPTGTSTVRYHISSAHVLVYCGESHPALAIMPSTRPT